MHDHIGLALSGTSQSLVSSRAASRIQRRGQHDFDDYLGLIDSPQDQGEFQVAVDLLTTDETCFFREPAHVNVLVHFDAATKRAVVDRVPTQLRFGALFFMGTAEGRVVSESVRQLRSPGAFRERAV